VPGSGSWRVSIWIVAVEGELDLAAQASSDFRHVRSAPIAGMMTRMSTRLAVVADLQRRLLVLEELAAYAALLRREALAREVRRQEREIMRALEPAAE
jgi:hypothetical protein